MKKLLSFILMGVLLISLVGCGGKETTTVNVQNDQASKEEVKKDEWPSKPIEVIVPFNPGGDTDFNGRAYINRMGDILGTNVVATNINGNGGALANNQAVKAKPNGYNALFHSSAFFVNQASGGTDFGIEAYEVAAVVGKSAGVVILVNSDSEYETLEDLIKTTQENPGEITFAANTGATTHVMAAQLNQAGAKFNIVDMGGGSERIAALLGGHVDVIPSTIGPALPYIESGDFKALALLEEERNDKIPDVPTAIEQGYDSVFKSYYMILLPKGTPQDIVSKVADAAEKISKTEAYKNDIAKYYQKPFFYKGEKAVEMLQEQQDSVLSLKDDLKTLQKQ